MPTNKPRFSITVDNELFEKINEYKFTSRINNQTQAVIKLIKLGLLSIENENKKVSDLDAEDRILLKLKENFNKLNEEGQNKLFDYSEDLVQSGRYIKNISNKIFETTQ